MRLLLSASLAFLITLPAAADFKIVIHRSFNGGQPRVETRLVQGARQRIETDRWIYLYQCDKQQLVQLNPETLLYGIRRIDPDGLPERQRPPRPQDAADESSYFVTTKETGDRATLFGYPAWRVRDTIVDDQRAMKTVIDSWYIDLPIRLDCSRSGQPPALQWLLADVKVRPTGSARRGFPLLTRTVHKWAGQTHEEVLEVRELIPTSFDPRLFDLPADYGKALDPSLTIPDTLAARTRKAWEDMWLNAARFFFEK